MGGGGDEASSTVTWPTLCDTEGQEAQDTKPGMTATFAPGQHHSTHPHVEALGSALKSAALASVATSAESVSSSLSSSSSLYEAIAGSGPDPARSRAPADEAEALDLPLPHLAAPGLDPLATANATPSSGVASPPSTPAGAAIPVGAIDPYGPAQQAKDEAKIKTLRRGKWTPEEERYVQQIINDFNNGTLAVSAGTTLRSYLSAKLNCDPMRITKKFTGDSCIGKRVFHPLERNPLNDAQVSEARETLKRLEARWLAKLDEQKRDADRKSKKALRHPANVLRVMLDGEQTLHSSVQSETLRWLREAQDALKSDIVTLQVVEELLFDGEEICAKFGIAVDADGGQTAAWTSTKRLASAMAPYTEPDANAASKRHRARSIPEMSSDQAAGGLLVDFLQSLREQTTP
uniref:Uncharacterized protein n=1 Tax=Rhizochromulina marina TaxID=1034831 RepID=A0A7S2R8N1_9STRA|mmetsp:Transcript_12718/g.36869  ORF Transcript_12718/g.36869 Transcript_12718/m.36869 type:complete len:405 (+) Transcript_12718:264-1478(+)